MTKIIQDIDVLRKPSEPVESVSEALSIIKDLEETLGVIDHGVGLAAVQIGIPKQVGAIKYKGSFFHLINPEVVETKDEFIFFREGCLSFPGIYRNTKRHRHFTIKNYRIDGDKFEPETLYFYYSKDPNEIGSDGLLSISVQHEMEHFRGEMILDHNIETEPVRRDSAKIGRNDPCPCGKASSNGKPLKYKKCCGK